VLSFAKLYPSLRPVELIDAPTTRRFPRRWSLARADSFFGAV